MVRKKASPIALLLMDQSVVSGIGNVYRAELLFRARLDPFRPGKEVPEELVRELWRDWVRLLRIGVETGQMLTMDDLDPEAYRKALASRDDRHWVYHRAGEPCRVCGHVARDDRVRAHAPEHHAWPHRHHRTTDSRSCDRSRSPRRDPPTDAAPAACARARPVRPRTRSG